jgi:hypothetical protein
MIVYTVYPVLVAQDGGTAMTNGSGPHPKRGKKKTPTQKGSGKHKPAAEVFKKALKPRATSSPKRAG